VGQGGDSAVGCPSVFGTGTLSVESEACPSADPLQAKGSGQMDTSGAYPPVREERTVGELDQIKQAAAEAWD
jgi:hypothetical protein